MLNDCQALAIKLLLPKTALNGPVPCVPSPLAQACGCLLYTSDAADDPEIV